MDSNENVSSDIGDRYWDDDSLFFPGDSEHEIITDVLPGSAELHHFNNHSNIPYSSIYIDGIEIYSCERRHEKKMIDKYKELYQEHAH